MNSMRYAIRRMLRSPGFSAMVVVTIALAVGVNLGVFSATQTVLFYSLGVPNSGRLLYYSLGNGRDATTFSGPAYEALRTNAALKDLLAWKISQFRLQTREGAPRIYGALVTGNTFSVFGIKPYLGRFFQQEDDAPGGGKGGWEAVLGYSYWTAHFAADPSVIGREIVVDGAPVHIVGILPKEFTGVVPVLRTDILLPSHFIAVTNPEENRYAYPGYMEWFVFGLLPKGMSIKGIEANLNVIEPTIRQLADPGGTVFSSALFSNTPPGTLLHVQSGELGAVPALKYLNVPFFGMQILALALLAFCCCNLILLLIGRGSREAHAISIRIAMGARLSNQIGFAMLEAAVLAAIGSAISAPVAWATARMLSLVIQSIPGFDGFPSISPSAPLLLESIGGVLVIACLSSALACTWQARRRSGPIMGTSTGRAPLRRSSRWIIGFEVFASILLITSVAVDGLGFEKIATQRSGFGTGSAVTATLDFGGGSGLDSHSGSGDLHTKMNRILEQVERSPGVQSVALMNMPPLSGGTAKAEVSVRGTNGSARDTTIWPEAVSVKYFSTLGTRILRGRAFRDEDVAGDPVCILSNQAASQLFGREDPLNQYLYQKAPYCRVIGIAEDAHLKSMSDSADAALYLLTKGDLPTIAVRATTSELAIEAVHNAILAVAPDTLATRIDTVAARINDDLRVWKIITLAGALCACIAAIILSIGFFGILSLQVSERKREIGIQIALGAGRTAICLSLVRMLRRPVAVGLVLGSGLALLTAAGLAKIYGLDPQLVIAAYLSSLVLLGLLLLAAAFVPMSRALAVSPMECLASE
jgi:putative ABC transport system permease protein